MTDPGQIKYEFGQILAMADALKGDAGTLDNSHETLQGHINTLMNTWDPESDSAQAFQGVQNRWNQSNREMIELLGRISQTVREGAERMNETERMNAARFAG
ncbi:WXG100 family type VII secretion target [Rhodococcus sp. NPDC058521]|uniref:WXG100 family type VII secretion target n=1 Tax=Rhodococcus sp. NPDC058521 TaxID=3346536 RepID=UPI00364A1138